MNRLFDLYTGSQEYKNEFPDKFGRARYYNSKNIDILDPVISKEIYSRGFKPRYPDNKKFAVCISHDIDHLFVNDRPQRKILNMSKELVKGRFKTGLTTLKSVFKSSVQADYDLRRLVELNNKYNVKATFYFLSLNKNEEDFNYSLHNIPDQLEYAVKGGGEIGLHGGHTAFNNPLKLAQEKKALEDCSGTPIFGYRNHYLKFELSSTWTNLREAGFLYDTTFGYADCIGFRNGMCYPFYPFDILRNEFLDIIELPLIIMDATLFYYMNLDPIIAFKICKQIIEKVKECQGVLTLLWHNNFLTGEMGAFYVKLLDFLQKEDPWFSTSLELVKWWKEENLMEESREIINELINTSE